MLFIITLVQLGLERSWLEGIEALLEVRFKDEGLKLMSELRELDHERLGVVLKTAKTASGLDEIRLAAVQDPE